MNINDIESAPITAADESEDALTGVTEIPAATDSLEPHWAEARQARDLRLAEAEAKARVEKETQAKAEADHAKFAHD